ncbi:hypothetical protein Pelo_18874 [Pelomyxa schiedti]|nr:hypothetical protein Pelo_18874 [Pelomyxa schiedti]
MCVWLVSVTLAVHCNCTVGGQENREGESRLGDQGPDTGALLERGSLEPVLRVVAGGHADAVEEARGEPRHGPLVAGHGRPQQRRRGGCQGRDARARYMASSLPWAGYPLLRKWT